MCKDIAPINFDAVTHVEDQDTSPLNITRETEMGYLGQASGALRTVSPLCDINNSIVYILIMMYLY